MEKNNYQEAVSVLPENVLEMLIDNGNYGVGSEANKNSAAKQRLAEILARARKQIKNKSKNSGGKIKISSLGGRKAATADKKNEILMFFWTRIK